MFATCLLHICIVFIFSLAELLERLQISKSLLMYSSALLVPGWIQQKDALYGRLRNIPLILQVKFYGYG